MLRRVRGWRAMRGMERVLRCSVGESSEVSHGLWVDGGRVEEDGGGCGRALPTGVREALQGTGFMEVLGFGLLLTGFIMVYILVHVLDSCSHFTGGRDHGKDGLRELGLHGSGTAAVLAQALLSYLSRTVHVPPFCTLPWRSRAGRR